MLNDLFGPFEPARTANAVIHHADMLDALRAMSADSVDSVVTDPPYHLTSVQERYSRTSLDSETDSNAARSRAPAANDALARLSRGFMGQTWDGGDIAFRAETWREVLRVLKPGGHLVAFGGTRTFHRMTVAIEDAGFTVRDRIRYETDAADKYGPLLDSLDPHQRAAVLEMLHEAVGGSELAWTFGSGFPKSHDIAQALDKIAQTKVSRDILKKLDELADTLSDEQDITTISIRHPQSARWQGWGSTLKPAYEPILLARKPLDGTIAGNVLAWGVGAINIDGCRIAADDAQGGEYTVKRLKPGATLNKTGGNWRPNEGIEYHGILKPGRFPANVIHNGSVAGFPETVSTRGIKGGTPPNPMSWGDQRSDANTVSGYSDSGSAARFFYCAKASKKDRNGSRHPTVKPVALIRYLCRLVTPPGGVVLDPFAGSGTTVTAALDEGFRVVAIERDPWFFLDTCRRLP